MLNTSAVSLMPTQQLSSTVSLIYLMLAALSKKDGRLAWGKFSMSLRPSFTACFVQLKLMCFDKLDSPKHFCNIYNDSVAVISLETQNLKRKTNEQQVILILW